MDRRIRHIILLFLSLLCGLFVSCSQSDDDACPDGEMNKKTVRFTFKIRLGDNFTTRALPGEDGTLEGTGYENFIDVPNLHFYIFNDNKYVAMLSDLTVSPSDDSEYPQEWDVTGEMDEPLSSSFQLVVLANWPSYPENLTTSNTIEDICTNTLFTFNYPSWMNGSEALSESNYIPMYGVKTFSGVTFPPNIVTSLGTIDLLRSMAKVEIICDMDEMTLSNVRLQYYNTKGFCAPLGMYENTSYVETTHIPNNVERSNETLNFQEFEKGKRFVIYIPEYDNVTVGTGYESRMSFDLTETSPDGDTYNHKTSTIYFRDYNNDKGADSNSRFNIVRNYHYRFYIKSMSSEPKIDYTVCPWNKVETSIEFN